VRRLSGFAGAWVVPLALLGAWLPAAFRPAVAAADSNVTVASTAIVGLDDFYTDAVSSSAWCGGESTQNPSCPQSAADDPQYGFPAVPASQESWGFAPTSANSCDPSQPQGSDPGCTDKAPNGFGIDPVAPATVALGSPFSVAQTWWYNSLFVGDYPAVLSVHGAVQVTPPGLPTFQIPLADPQGNTFVSRIYLNNHVGGGVRPCDPEFSRPGDLPCDDYVEMAGLKNSCSPSTPCVYSQVADGLTWELSILGFADPGNPPGDLTSDLLIPPPCNWDPSACPEYPNTTVASHPLIAPIMASLSVNTSSTATSVSTSAGSVRYGAPVTFSAGVSPAPSTGGTVSFEDGGVSIAGCGSQPVDTGSGAASCTTSSLGTGSHAITAVYSGALGFGGSMSAGLTQTVVKADTSTSLVSSANPAVAGQKVTYTASISASAPGAGSPGGSVAFGDGAATITGCGSVAVSGAQASCSVTYADLTGSPHQITASYSGDGNFNSSSSPVLSEVVSKVPTKLMAAPVRQGLLTLTFSGTLTRATDGGAVADKTVAFSVSGYRVCQATTNTSGVASCTILGLAITLGPATYTASFAGDSQYLASSATGKL
jgi:hypothetical protein